MTDRKQEVWLQVTAGQGPSECAWAVVKVLEQIQQEAKSASLEFKMIGIELCDKRPEAYGIDHRATNPFEISEPDSRARVLDARANALL